MGETNLIFTLKLDILVINFTLEMLIVAAWELQYNQDIVPQQIDQNCARWLVELHKDSR